MCKISFGQLQLSLQVTILFTIQYLVLKGEFEEAIGRSRGGRTSKIHALADDRGRPVAFALTPGNVADVVMAIPKEREARVEVCCARLPSEGG